MTKTFMTNIKKLWKKEGFEIKTINVKPINNNTIEWKIVGKVKGKGVGKIGKKI